MRGVKVCVWVGMGGQEAVGGLEQKEHMPRWSLTVIDVRRRLRLWALPSSQGTNDMYTDGGGALPTRVSADGVNMLMV